MAPIKRKECNGAEYDPALAIAWPLSNGKHIQPLETLLLLQISMHLLP